MFYRSLLAALAAVVIASPVFADDTMGSSDTTGASMQSTQTDASSATTTQEAAKVNLNTATAKELMKVPGISPSKARAIVTYRDANGDFKSVDDLANVKGFKEMKAKKPQKLQDITNHLTVE